jgi:hypothetical protein
MLLVTVKAGVGTLESISFGTPTSQIRNASVEPIGSSTTYQTFGTLTLPAGVTQQAFVVRRLTAGQPVHVPLSIVDGCGPWTSLVGAGTSAF